MISHYRILAANSLSSECSEFQCNVCMTFWAESPRTTLQPSTTSNFVQNYINGQKKLIGKFENPLHGVSGVVYTVPDKSKLLVEDFSYDGRGPDAFFWVGTEGNPSSLFLTFVIESKLCFRNPWTKGNRACPSVRGQILRLSRLQGARPKSHVLRRRRPYPSTGPVFPGHQVDFSLVQEVCCGLWPCGGGSCKSRWALCKFLQKQRGTEWNIACHHLPQTFNTLHTHLVAPSECLPFIRNNSSNQERNSFKKKKFDLLELICFTKLCINFEALKLLPLNSRLVANKGRGFARLSNRGGSQRVKTGPHALLYANGCLDSTPGKGYNELMALGGHT